MGDPSWTAQRKQARAALQEAVKRQCGLYTFYGDFGSGKTLALQSAINELRQEMVEGYYAPFAVIVDHLRDLFSAHKDTSAYWQRLLDVPVLALDEVSRFDDGRAWIRARLFVLADTRYRAKHSRLTLFATNANPKVTLPPDDTIGYLFSRMREGRLCELRGDLRSEVHQW
jgi:DNA replication protein DnaC